MTKSTPILLFLLAFTFFIPTISNAQETPQTFSVADLKSDLNTLKENLKTSHIGLYEYTSEKEFDQFFESVSAEITEPMTDGEFYMLLKPIHAVIKNGHTKVGPSASFAKSLESKKFLPMAVYWDKKDIYILRNNSSNDQLTEGSKLVSVNGESAKDLLLLFASQLTRDGNNQTAPERGAMEMFSAEYAYFRGNPEQFEVEIVTPQGEQRSLSILADSREVLLKRRAERYGKPSSFYSNDQPALELIMEDKVATMIIRSFSADFVRKEKKQKFKRFYKDAFMAMEKAGTEHLILDLRGNGGGDPLPTIDLMAYLHPEPFTFYRRISANHKKIQNQELYDIGFLEKKLSPMIMKKVGDHYEVNGLGRLVGGVQGTKETKPNKHQFGGTVYCLTDADSFSATGEMTAILKQHNRAIFVGEEAGGNPNQNVSGIQLLMTLPKTKTRAIMPFWLWEMNYDLPNTGHGVIPDHPITPSIEDVLEGRDAVMEYTKELISRKQ